jgi:hypothetical protein
LEQILGRLPHRSSHENLVFKFDSGRGERRSLELRVPEGIVVNSISRIAMPEQRVSLQRLHAFATSNHIATTNERPVSGAQRIRVPRRL